MTSEFSSYTSGPVSDGGMDPRRDPPANTGVLMLGDMLALLTKQVDELMLRVAKLEVRIQTRPTRRGKRGGKNR